MAHSVHVVGAGLSGCEAAWQLAEMGFEVLLFEMKPLQFSPAHELPGFAELVCSNSLGSLKPSTGSGLLKQEMQTLGSLILKTAHAHQVPAGNALAINRDEFSAAITEQLTRHPNIHIIHQEYQQIDPQQPTILATGPLTADALAKNLAKLIGQKFLHFYDAIAPVVELESLDLSPLFWGARYDTSNQDYLNVPLEKTQYEALMDGILQADKVPLHDFEKPNYFEACLPLDVLAARGRQTLAFGAWKPVGLINPHTGKRPYAVIQLRRENHPTTMLSMVGCQNKLKWPAQEALFRQLPGFANVRFVRLGAVHRNTYLDAPKLLHWDLSLRQHPNIYITGVLAGVEGYLESAATGLAAALYCGKRLLQQPMVAMPATSILGALLQHLCHGPEHFQPMNCNFALLPPLAPSDAKVAKEVKRDYQVQQAVHSMQQWWQENRGLVASST